VDRLGKEPKEKLGRGVKGNMPVDSGKNRKKKRAITRLLKRGETAWNWGQRGEHRQREGGNNGTKEEHKKNRVRKKTSVKKMGSRKLVKGNNKQKKTAKMQELKPAEKRGTPKAPRNWAKILRETVKKIKKQKK